MDYSKYFELFDNEKKMCSNHINNFCNGCGFKKGNGCHQYRYNINERLLIVKKYFENQQ